MPNEAGPFEIPPLMGVFQGKTPRKEEIWSNIRPHERQIFCLRNPQPRYIKALGVLFRGHPTLFRGF